MTRQDRVEILAQALWMGMFGTNSITADWMNFQQTNTQQANAFREQASTMIDVADSAGGSHSLGWTSQPQVTAIVPQQIVQGP